MPKKQTGGKKKQTGGLNPYFQAMVDAKQKKAPYE